MPTAETPATSSPLAEAVARVGDRWTLLIVQALLDGSRRFNDLLETLPGIAPNILSKRLDHLQREALVVSQRYSDRPPRFAYQLTAAGQELAGALRLLAQWGAQRSGEGDSLRHLESPVWSTTPRRGSCGSREARVRVAALRLLVP